MNGGLTDGERAALAAMSARMEERLGHPAIGRECSCVYIDRRCAVCGRELRTGYVYSDGAGPEEIRFVHKSCLEVVCQ